VNEDVCAYGLQKHAHVPEMTKTLSILAGVSASLTFTPHLIPMTRGILATCYARGKRPPRNASAPHGSSMKVAPSSA